MVNKIFVCGHLGADPLKKAIKDLEVSEFSIATNYISAVEWHSIVAFGKVAESCNTFLKKGSLVLVEGRNKTERWEKDGKKFQKTKIIAQSVKFLSRDDDGCDSYPQESHTQPTDSEPLDDKEIPF